MTLALSRRSADNRRSGFRFAGLLGAFVAVVAAASPADAETFRFQTVVNNADLIPGTSSVFNAYNQPSINSAGLVVFRARGRGGSGIGQPATGIFTRDLLDTSLPRPIVPIALRDGPVPNPNNTGATFTEFPSFPRISLTTSAMVAFRGQSSPVWRTEDGSFGTSGIYSNPLGTLGTGASQLGGQAGFGFYGVPTAAGSTGQKFDQFPGAPAVTDNKVVFKGNWTDSQGDGRTGVYFRDLIADGGASPVRLIADSTTAIPSDPLNRIFGSTAPPSAAQNMAVFLGLDNEDSPSAGGIYLSSLLGDPTALSTLVNIGGLQDLTDAGGLTNIGEVLSFNGDSVAYWAAWGSDTFTQQVTCAGSGNQALINFCKGQSEDASTGGVGNGAFQFEVPFNQGIFVTDIESKLTRMIARTGEEFSSFLSWNFSGRPPGVGEGEEEGDQELARWRSSSFMALDFDDLAFKGLDLQEVEGLTGIFEVVGSGLFAAGTDGTGPIRTIVTTGMDGGVIDPDAAGIPIVSLGLERDGYRNGRIVFAAGMALEGETEADSVNWAGLYVAEDPVDTVPGPLPVLGVASAFGVARRIRRRLRRS
jgi:hypothetical protein